MKKDQLPLEAYEAPKVEVIEVEVERGFAGSDGDIDTYGEGTGWS